MTSTTLCHVALLLLSASGCASTVNATVADAMPDASDASPGLDAAADTALDVARDVLDVRDVLDAPDAPSTPDVAVDLPDAPPDAPCAVTLVARDFTLTAGSFGRNALVFDQARRALLLVGSDTGRVLRVDPDTGAVERITPGRYSATVDAQVAIDARLGVLVSVPVAASDHLFLTLDLARLDHWESLNELSGQEPSGLLSWVAGYDAVRSTLHLVGTSAPGATRRFGRWTFHADDAARWTWARAADFEAPSATSLGPSGWEGSRDGLLVFLRLASGEVAQWSIGDATAAALPWGLAPEGQLLGAIWDPSRRVTWMLESNFASARLTALPPDTAGSLASATVRDPMGLLYTTTTNRSPMALDPARRRLYVYSDNTVAGRPSAIGWIPVDRCVP